MDSLPYEEPAFWLVCSLVGFVLLLNLSRHLVDHLCYAGLIAQVLLGALWGAPLGSSLLPLDLQTSIRTLGYLGLLLLVAQGGAEARLDILSSPRNAVTALLVGLTGIALPIGLSMLLLPLAFGYEPLQAFACGASMSSTSLGTILTLLSTVKSLEQQDEKGAVAEERDATVASSTSATSASNAEHGSGGLLDTRLGTILVGAALLDDVVGLVMSKVILVIGPSAAGGGIQPWTIVRPILSSSLMMATTAVLGRWVVGPSARWISRKGLAQRVRLPPRASKVVDGEGVLAAAWICITLLYVVIAHYVDTSLLIGAFCSGALLEHASRSFSRGGSTASATVTQRLGTLQGTLLLPFFFASIGFAIPLRSLFGGMVVWKGFVYAGLMALAKAAAGLWLVVVDAVEGRRGGAATGRADMELERREREDQPVPSSMPGAVSVRDRPRRWGAPLLLGCSLVARGEIGFLIVGLAQQAGLVGGSEGMADEALQVTVWALLLNTVVGPICAGLIVKWKRGEVMREVMRGRWGRAGA